MHILSPGYRNTNVAALYASAGGSLLDGSESDGTNQLTGGQSLFTSDWGSVEATLTPSNAVAPNGATEAARLLETTANDRHIIYGSAFYLPSAGASFTYSVYAKAINRQYIQLMVGSGAATRVYAYFDLINGTVTDSGFVSGSGGTAVSATSIQAAVNGFYKCSMTMIYDGSTSVLTPQIDLSDVATFGAPLSANSPQYTGNASNGAYLWRAKVV